MPFLLSTAVFTRLSVIELSLPAQNSGVEQLKVDDLKLEVADTCSMRWTWVTASAG